MTLSLFACRFSLTTGGFAASVGSTRRNRPLRVPSARQALTTGDQLDAAGAETEKPTNQPRRHVAEPSWTWAPAERTAPVDVASGNSKRHCSTGTGPSSPMPRQTRSLTSNRFASSPSKLVLTNVFFLYASTTVQLVTGSHA
ncbi:unnamed protein product [Protopolystoma xenopodis]|uniref:Secreted protein n=1 Tax=Protopolystoma xenopodis TaxID=117903 RepID=A0A448XS71_9PLAT|nr:unnamed protein product [Protopolystoma xenopodis]